MPAKAKKPAGRDDDGSTEMDVAAFQAELDTDEGPILAKKKDKKPAQKVKSKKQRSCGR